MFAFLQNDRQPGGERDSLESQRPGFKANFM